MDTWMFYCHLQMGCCKIKHYIRKMISLLLLSLFFAQPQEKSQSNCWLKWTWSIHKQCVLMWLNCVWKKWQQSLWDTGWYYWSGCNGWGPREKPTWDSLKQCSFLSWASRNWRRRALDEKPGQYVCMHVTHSYARFHLGHCL